LVYFFYNRDSDCCGIPHPPVRACGSCGDPGAAEALTTISPDNAYSLANALRAGYTVVTQTSMYDGLDRYILRKVFE
jgi:hypothetical protein